MKAGIEDGDLRHWTQQFRDNVYAFQFGAIVKWRKNGNAFDRRLDLSGNDRGLEILRTAVDHAVSHNIDIGRAGNRLRLAAPQAIEQALNGFPTRAHRCLVFSGSSAGVLDRVFSLVICPLELTLPNATRWIGWERIPNVVETALLAAGAGVENKHVHSIRPSPVTDFRQIVSAFANVLFMLDKFVAQQLFEVASDALQSWNTVHYIPSQVEAIKIVQDRHVERCCRRALLFVAPHVEIVMIVAAISEAVNQPGIAVIGKDDRLIHREHGVEIKIRETVRMLGRGLNGHQIDNIHHANPDVGKMLPQEIDRCQCFERGDITGARHHDIGFGPVVCTCPLPNANTGSAVFDGGLHVEPLQCGLLAGNDHIDIMAASQTMIGDGKQAIGVGRKVNANDVGFLIYHMIDEAGILMSESIVILPPYVRCQQVIERRDRAPPLDLAGNLQPLSVLVEHGINNVDEGFIAREEAMTPGEQITFQPALAHVLTEHLQYTTAMRKM